MLVVVKVTTKVVKEIITMTTVIQKKTTVIQKMTMVIPKMTMVIQKITMENHIRKFLYIFLNDLDIFYFNLYSNSYDDDDYGYSKPMSYQKFVH